MAKAKRKRKDVKVKEIYVITASIVSSYNDGTCGGPMCVTMYFLAKYIGNEYYELFSGKKLEKENQAEYGFLSHDFDTPYVKKAEPLKQYLVNPNEKRIDIQSLFDFITNMNVRGSLGAFSE